MGSAAGGPVARRVMGPENVLRFGIFELDLRARELRKGGIRVRLQDQPFVILRLVLERPGDVVTREELRRQLWPNGTFVDFEHSLNAAVKRLRAALGDDAKNPRFIETLPRRGYRFIASVHGQRSACLVPVTLPSAAISSTSSSEQKLRVAVLPFIDLGADVRQKYFSDGLTDELITQLGRICPRALGVIARTSVMLFKDAGKSASEIGKALGVDYLLEGSVRRQTDRVRITAQLIDTREETHVWGGLYETQLEDSFHVQADLAARIARSSAMALVRQKRAPGTAVDLADGRLSLRR